MISEERKKYIIDELEKFGIVRVTDLGEKLKTTEVTIRRDLDELQSSGMAIRIRGGAKIKNYASLKMTLVDNDARCVSEREKIAALAYEQIRPNDTIILDSSATVLQLARMLRTRPISNLTILTPSFNNFMELSTNAEYTLIFVGGKYNRQMNSTNGHFAQLVLENVHADKSFLGSAGVDADGFSGPYEEETRVKHLSIKNADASFVLADHTKFAKCFLYRFAQLGEIDYVVTDLEPDKEIRDAMLSTGVVLLY